MLTATVNTKNFNKTFADYMKVTSRNLEESILQHSYYVARDAVNVTGAATKSKIKSELMAPSRVDPSAPLAAMIVNKQLGQMGQKGLTGPAMTTAVEDLVNKRQRSINFVRSGWLPAVRKLAALVKSKGGKSLKGTVQHGRDKGGANVHKSKWSPFVEIYNDVFGGKHPNVRVSEIKRKGAQEALELERQSMLKYIKRKQEQAADRFNRGISQALFG